MKKIYLFGLLSVLFISCRERNTGIDYIVAPKGSLFIDSQYIAQGVPSSFPKRVLIEDFSGIKCANCPAAATLIAGIESANPLKVSEIVMYSSLDGSITDSFGPIPPNPGSKSSYKVIDADQIRRELGGSAPLPEVAVNRRNFDLTQARIVFDRNNLQSNFDKEINLSTNANISFLNKSYNAATHTIAASIQVQYGATAPDSDYLSIALTESNLIDLQDSNGFTAYLYVHNNVLRKYIFPETGIVMSAATKGKTYVISFNTTIPSGWVPENMKAVAILHKHKAVTNNYYVTQVNETPVR